jgi:hypothetical protein
MTATNIELEKSVESRIAFSAMKLCWPKSALPRKRAATIDVIAV